MEKNFRNYSQALSKPETETSEGTNRIAIDGKVLKGSFNHLKESPMLQLLNVFCTSNQIILGHVEIPEKTNEIPTAQLIIKELGFLVKEVKKACFESIHLSVFVAPIEKNRNRIEQREVAVFKIENYLGICTKQLLQLQ